MVNCDLRKCLISSFSCVSYGFFLRAVGMRLDNIRPFFMIMPIDPMLLLYFYYWYNLASDTSKNFFIASSFILLLKAKVIGMFLEVSFISELAN